MKNLYVIEKEQLEKFGGMANLKLGLLDMNDYETDSVPITREPNGDIQYEVYDYTEHTYTGDYATFINIDNADLKDVRYAVFIALDASVSYDSGCGSVNTFGLVCINTSASMHDVIKLQGQAEDINFNNDNDDAVFGMAVTAQPKDDITAAEIRDILIDLRIGMPQFAYRLDIINPKNWADIAVVDMIDREEYKLIYVEPDNDIDKSEILKHSFIELQFNKKCILVRDNAVGRIFARYVNDELIEKDKEEK